MRIPIGRIKHDIRTGKITRLGQLFSWSDEYGDRFDENDWAKLFDGRPSYWYNQMKAPHELKAPGDVRIAVALEIHEEEVTILIARELIYHCTIKLEQINKKRPPEEPIIMAS